MWVITVEPHYHAKYGSTLPGHMLLFCVQENVVSIDASVYHGKLGSDHLILVGEGLVKFY